MARRILGIVAGYVAMFIAILATFSLAYRLLGAERSFRPGTYDASGTWLVVSFVLGLLAAIIGGSVAARIGGLRAVRLLAIVVVILGIAVGVTTITSEQDPGPRTGPVSNSEAMQKVKQPHWVTFVNPILGAAGVLIGGRRAAARMVAG